ncbi:MAG: GNAT family N-acetyltransferase [Planctomycetes bacterium]|nr:GNAT family N-acetyltransferase [Planctomycetota bacterium]
MSNVIEINDLEQLAGYRLHWQRLLGQTRRATFFQSLDWLEVYWRHYGQGQKLRVLIVEAHGEVIGIVPLVVRRKRSKLGRMRVLTYPLDDWGTFYGPIGPNPTATLHAAMQHIHSTTRDWDLLDLRWINNDHVDHRRTELAMRKAGFGADKKEMGQAGIADLRDGWEAYWAARTSKWRTNVRADQRKLAKLGRVSYVHYRPGGTVGGEDDPRWDLYDACEEVARRSWQSASQTGTTLSHESVRSYLRDVHAVAVRCGALDVHLLLVDGRPVAFAYNYYWDGYVSGLRMGFDAQGGAKGAGTVLLRYALKESAERGDHTYDMGAGYLACKYRWLSRTETIYRYTHYPLVNIRAQAMRAKHWLQRSLNGPPQKSAPKAAGA